MTETLDDVAVATSTKQKRQPKRTAEQEAERAAIRALVKAARGRGEDLTGPEGLLRGITKQVLETALDEEMTDHLGYDKHDPDGYGSGNSRNGTRTKTVLTDNAGPVTVEVPRDRNATFEPVIVPKRTRRLGDVDTIVLSLFAKGLTTGEISAHFAEIYGASVSKETVSRITDRVLDELEVWKARPLQPGRFLSVVANRWSEPSSHELSWGAVAEDESGSVVEFVSYLGQAFVADLVEVRALGEVLAE